MLCWDQPFLVGWMVGVFSPFQSAGLVDQIGLKPG